LGFDGWGSMFRVEELDLTAGDTGKEDEGFRDRPFDF
jgi:hypothetical protein